MRARKSDVVPARCAPTRMNDGSCRRLAVTVPTLLRFGSADPFARFATFFSSTDAGGVFVMKL